jgi:hypothetical protein
VDQQIASRSLLRHSNCSAPNLRPRRSIVSKVGGVPEGKIMKNKSKNPEVSPQCDKNVPDQFNKCGVSQPSVPLSLAILLHPPNPHPKCQQSQRNRSHNVHPPKFGNYKARPARGGRRSSEETAHEGSWQIQHHRLRNHLHGNAISSCLMINFCALFGDFQARDAVTIGGEIMHLH